MNRKARITLGSVALVAALMTAGCSTGGGTPDESNAPSTEISAEAEAAQAIVDAAMEPVGEFVAPGPAFDASTIEGGTVYYIVPALEAAVFQQYADRIEGVLSNFDLTLQQCGTNGGSPDGIANCLAQAVDAKASAVIVMVIPYELAPTGFDAVTAAGIPLVYALTTPSGPGDPTEVGYFSPDFVGLQSLNASWVIADSNASASVLVVRETDNPAVSAWTEFGTLPTYAEGCPDCTVKEIPGSTSQMDKITTDVTASIVSDPSVGYIQVPAETYLAAAIAGAQAAGKTTDDIRISSMDANPSGITQLQQGQWLAAASGNDIGASSWYIVDQVARMLAGQPAVANVEFPYSRLFTRDNVADLDPTDAAWESGEWYGDSDYQAGFLELWGLE